MFKFSGSSYLTSALSYSVDSQVRPSPYVSVGLPQRGFRRNQARSALGAILESNAQSSQPNVGLENESEAGMLGLQEFEQQFAFKDLMIHLILQFTLHIAFRGVLHRCGNQEIHR